MSRSGSKSFKSTISPRTIWSLMQGGTTGRNDGGNWLGVDKPSEFTPVIIGGGLLEAGTASASETVATTGVSGGGGAATLDTGRCVSSAEGTAAETASAIQYIVWGSDGAAFTIGFAAARGERRSYDVASAVERRERVVLDLRILKKLRNR